MGKTNIMLDLETWGVERNPVIVSIGACVFGPNSIGPAFKVNLSPVGQPGNIEPMTILWWMGQSREAISLSIEDSMPSRDALVRFSEWLSDFGGVALWGNGSNFDNRILRESYEAHELSTPWHYRDDRDFRTLVALHGKSEVERKGVHHDALDDALFQAECAVDIMRRAGLWL